LDLKLIGLELDYSFWDARLLSMLARAIPNRFDTQRNELFTGHRLRW